MAAAAAEAAAKAADEEIKSGAVVDIEILEEGRAVARRKSSLAIGLSSAENTSVSQDLSRSSLIPDIHALRAKVRRKKSSGNSVTFAVEDKMDKRQIPRVEVLDTSAE